MEALRIASGRGVKPHLCLAFSLDGGSYRFGIDTTPSKIVSGLLITHAHSDHYGKSAMRSPLAWASQETAWALEIIHGQPFQGRTFQLGDSFEIGDVTIKTFPTLHTPGAAAYYWENENGTRFLVTGDVKTDKYLPRCDLLVTEANYGDPYDPECHFHEDLELFREVVEDGDLALGAYRFGKSQRTVELLREMGYTGEIGMDPVSLQLTRKLTKNTEPLTSHIEDINVTQPPGIRYKPHKNKYIVTARKNYCYPNIPISDHMNVQSLLGMVKKCSPEHVIVYHPRGPRPAKLARYLEEKEGIGATPLEKLEIGVGTP